MRTTESLLSQSDDEYKSSREEAGYLELQKQTPKGKALTLLYYRANYAVSDARKLAGALNELKREHALNLISNLIKDLHLIESDLIDTGDL